MEYRAELLPARTERRDTPVKTFKYASTLSVTVIIPERNEEGRIGACLDSILDSSLLPGELEILVVDGRSTDSSCRIVSERATRNPSIRLIDNPRRTVSCGLNIGIREARGQTIVILGAHCVYPRDYLATCIRELQNTGADAVGGTLVTLPGADTLVAKALSFITQHPFGVGSSAFRLGHAGKYVDTVPYGAYRREVFERVGIFNEELVRNQDFEFNSRVRRAGGKLFLSPAMQIIYYNVCSFWQLSVQAFNNGRWLVDMWRLSPLSFRLRHCVPLLFVSVLLLCAVLAPATHLAVVMGGLVLSAYFAALIISALQISWYRGSKYFLPAMGLFAVHHITYGAGTLSGLMFPRRLLRVAPKEECVDVDLDEPATNKSVSRVI